MVESKPKFVSLKSLFVVTAVIAILLGWQATYRRYLAAAWRAQRLAVRMDSLESSIEELYTRPTPQNTNNSLMGLRLFSSTTLDGCNLAGLTIQSTRPEFQSVSLARANLEGVNISAGPSSFQKACFDEANLRGAQLTASGAAFQYVTFKGADLSGSRLTAGGGADFQIVSLRDAKLIGATIVCSGSSAFTSVDVTNCDFSDADLSAIDKENLQASYFASPPTYNRKTKFPAGFDAGQAGWKSTP